MLIRLFSLSPITKGFKAKVEISLKLSQTIHFIHNPTYFSSKLSKISIKSYVLTFKSRWAYSSHSQGSVSVDLFNLLTLPDERRVATSYWIFLSISIYRTGKTLKSAKLSADKRSTDKLLMVMRDLSSRSSISKGLSALIYT